MCTALVFKGHSLGGTSIASLSVNKKCTVDFAHAGQATRRALPRFLVFEVNLFKKYIVDHMTKHAQLCPRVDIQPLDIL